MGNIVLLDELTINQIAAGEVIERPASVIKEMVENSIDAGATNITIEIKNGGISYIRISDNGKGIAKDDVELAFERHATSKIRSAEDLQDVKSMGFRGEALASIAAIANVELITKNEEDQTGTKIIVEGGNILNIEEVGATKGTIITVRNLFFNTPVRYKFLKKDFTETGYIEDVVTRIALVHPEIAIKLINTGKTVIQTNGNGELKSVIYSIYGKDIAEELLPVSYEYEYIKVSGVIGKPSIARSNRANQIFFVNKRYIKDKTLTSGAEQAFKGMLPIGKFGFLVLNLEMNPNKVDVNVHPAKLEVRFEEESVAFKAVYHAIKNTLASADLISEREKNKEAKEISKDAFKIQPNQIMEETANTNFGGLFNRGVQSENNQEKTETKIQEEQQTTLETSSDMDVFDKIKKLQDELKKQIAENPKLEVTEDYKKMEQKYNEIASAADVISKQLDAKIEQTQTGQANAIEEEDNEKKLEESQKTYINAGIENVITSDKNNESQSINENINEENTEKDIVEDNNIENNLDSIEREEKNIESNVEDAKAKEDYIENNEGKSIENNSESSIKEESNDAESKENKETIESLKEVNDKILSFESMYKKLFGKEPYGGRLKPEEPKKEEKQYKIGQEDLSENISVFEDMEEYKKPTYKFIGIAFKTYIILEMNQELYIMDQHAAHERIMYEKVKSNFYSNSEKDSQMLLLPDIITLTGKEMNIAKDNFDLFEKAGFILEEFGENTIKLSGVPEICVDLDTKEMFLETLDEINTVARTAKQEKEEKFLATIACKAAVKANMALTEDEVNSLMEQLLKLPNPFTCPHGRPTVIRMSKYDIERKFARK